MKKTCDTSPVRAALESIVPYLRAGNLVILESTVPPMTCQRLVKPLGTVTIHPYNERVAKGTITLHEVVPARRCIASHAERGGSGSRGVAGGRAGRGARRSGTEARLRRGHLEVGVDFHGDVGAVGLLQVRFVRRTGAAGVARGPDCAPR